MISSVVYSPIREGSSDWHHKSGVSPRLPMLEMLPLYLKGALGVDRPSSILSHLAVHKGSIKTSTGHDDIALACEE